MSTTLEFFLEIKTQHYTITCCVKLVFEDVHRFRCIYALFSVSPPQTESLLLPALRVRLKPLLQLSSNAYEKYSMKFNLLVEHFVFYTLHLNSTSFKMTIDTRACGSPL